MKSVVFVAAIGVGVFSAIVADAQTPSPSSTPAVTATVKPAATPTATPAATATAKPAASVTATPTPKATTPTATPAATPIAVPTPEPVPDEQLEGYGIVDPNAPKLSGWITAKYDTADGKGPSYRAQNGYTIPFARLNLDGKASPILSYHASIELTDVLYASTTPPRTVAGLRDAYVVWNPHKLLKIQAGQFKKILGYETRTDEKDLIPVDRSQTSELIYSNDIRDIGVVLSVPLGPLSYAIGVTNGSDPNSSDFDNHKDIVTRGGFLLNGSGLKLDAGISAYGGQESSHELWVPAIPNDQFIDYWRAAYDVHVEAGPMVVISEGVYGNTTFKTPPPGSVGIATATSSAAYLLFGWRLMDDRMTPWFRYEYRDLSSGDDGKNPIAALKDWSNGATIGINYEVVRDRALARFQYSQRSGFTSAQENLEHGQGTLAAWGKDLRGTASFSLQVEY